MSFVHEHEWKIDRILFPKGSDSRELERILNDLPTTKPVDVILVCSKCHTKVQGKWDPHLNVVVGRII